MHSFSRTHTNRLLSGHDGRKRGVGESDGGARAGLKSATACGCATRTASLSHRIAVKATERIRPDCVYLVHGFGHKARGLRHAFGKGASDAGLITRYKHDPLMGGTAMNVNFVTLEPATQA
jgi:thiosulfate reductase/polysulfide reductase chain A